jgi:hypothetical protein
MGMAPITKEIISNANADTTSALEDLTGLEHIHIQVEGTTVSDSGFTVRAYGSFSPEAPDFSSAVALDNPYFGLATKDYSNDNTDDNSTGIAVGASATHVQGYLVNVDELKWFCVKVEDVSGTVDVSVRLYAGNSI